jgi:hypothetical protein
LMMTSDLPKILQHAALNAGIVATVIIEVDYYK